RSARTLTAPAAGSAASSAGGVVSCGPPLGATGWAQPASRRQQTAGSRQRDRTYALRRPLAARCPPSSGIDPAELERPGHPLDRDDVGRDAERHAVLLARVVDLVEGLVHHPVEAAVDAVEAPEVAVAVLDPLEVGDRHAAGVGEDVRDDDDAVLLEDGVGGGGRGAVGALGDDP